MASSSDSLRAGNVTRTFKDVINSESASLALQTLLTQFKQKGNDTVAFSSGTLQSIWHGNLQPFNENSPSNFSIFTITENKPGQDDGMARIYLHLVSASKNQQVSLESLKASTIQVISTPGNYEELIERLTSYTQWYGLSFGNRSSGHEGLAALVLKFVSLKGLIRARFAANHMYGAMICHAIDTRVHIHLKQCELATEREDVDDSFVNFSSLWQDIQTNQFMIHLPTCFKSTKDPKDSDNDSLQAAKTLLSLGGFRGGGGGGGGGKKRKERNERETNEDQHDDLKLRENESWRQITGKEVDSRPKWGMKRMCARWHINGNCFSDCNNHESHVGKNDIPAEKLSEMIAWLRKVRQA